MITNTLTDFLRAVVLIAFATSAALAGGVCTSDIVCEFDGFPNVALGQTTLTEVAGSLRVNNIGGTGDDGVRIVNDLKASSFQTAHNDWIDLGDTGLGNIDETANGPGSYIHTSTVTILSNFASGEVSLDVDQINATDLRISHDFTIAGPASITYEVWNGTLICGSAGQAVNSTVTVNTWPSRMAFSELQFPVLTAFTLPTASCSGTELRIIPVFTVNPHPVPLYALQQDITVKKNVSILDLSPLVIASEAFGVPAPPSGMAFSAELTLSGPGAFPEDGTNVIALPFSRQVGMFIASDLIADIGGAACAGPGPVLSVARYVQRTAGLDGYTGCSGRPFALDVGETYYVKVTEDLVYRVVGLHRPGLAKPLSGPATFPEDGTNPYGPPYHGIASTASDLIADIGGAACAGGGPVLSVARYLKSVAGLQSYTGCGGTDFALSLGEGYFVKVDSDTNYIPLHF